MADLKTDFKDDVLNTEVNDKRRYRMIQNSDGTVSFEDVTDYLTVGDDFGSAEVNEITGAINGLNNNLSESVVKLWDNPNPNASFNPQTVNVDLSKYKKVGIVAKQTHNTTNGSVGYSETIIGLNGTLFSGNVDSPTVAYRCFSSGSNFVTFYTGHYIYGGSQGTSPDWAIPVAIYGIK